MKPALVVRVPFVVAAGLVASCANLSGLSDSTARDGGSSDAVATSHDVGAGCLIGGKTYASDARDPTNACQGCLPTVSNDGWSDVSDGTKCGVGGICHTGACVSGCEIGGVEYATGATNPNDPCESCQPGASTAVWSSLPDGVDCGNGQLCGSGVCGQRCDIGETVFASGAANASNSCQSCQPGTSTTAWTDAANGTSCGTGDVCSGAICGAGCYVGGAVYASGAANPGNPCESCDPAASTTAWTRATNGAACGPGEVCSGGTCGAGCSIGGTVYPSGAASPSGSCQTCQPLTSTVAWSNVPNTTSCGGSGTCSSGSCIQPPSCAPGGAGMTNCGATAESCCVSPEVPGGTYDRTYTNVGTGPTGQADPATVSGYRLDKYMVTVGRFRQFVNAWDGGAGYTPPPGSGKHAHLNAGQGLVDSGAQGTVASYEPGWVASDDSNLAPTNMNLACDATYATWTAAAGSQENLTMNCVSWYESYAFCIWDGGFLPSEAEWEYAAAGGSQELEYPWGATPPGTANDYAIYGCYYPSGSGSCSGVSNIAPVGTATLGTGRWGQLDLAGDLWESNLDWYGAYVDPCTDCAYLTAAAGSARVIRGGRFSGSASLLLPASRGNNAPTARDSDLGFRCARTP